MKVMRFLLLFALGLALSITPAFAQFTPPGIVTTPGGIGIGTATPGSDWDLSKGGVPLEIKSATAGFVLYINQDNIGANDKNSYGIYVDSESQFDPPFYSNMSNGKAITQLGHYSSNIGTNWFFRDVPASVSNIPVVFIEQDNAADDQAALLIQQDGTGDIIDTAGDKFVVKPGGAVLSNDTFYFKYSGAGGSPLCYSASGGYSGYMFLRPCAGSSPTVTEICIGSTCINESQLQALVALLD